MNKRQWELLFKEAIASLRKQKFVPYDTGNLKFNAIKGMWVNDDTFRIYIDEKVAPYVYSTQEKWDYGNNPNQGWVDKAVKYLASYISRKLNGDIK